MSYILKRIIFLLVVFLLSYAYYHKRTILYISVDEHHKIQIPKQIVWSRNCDQYMEWLHNQNISISFTTICPWSQLTQDSIVEFAFNDLNLYIPGEYIWQNKLDNTNNEYIHLILKYPDMIASTDKNNENNSYNINVILNPLPLNKTCINHSCTNISEIEYMNITNITSNAAQNIPNKIEKLYKLSKFKLIAYKINNIEEFLIRGNPLKPSYWLYCDGGKYSKNPHPKCKSYMNYNDKINIYYDFDYTSLLDSHNEIKNKILEKIDQFRYETFVQR
ncbi:MAG: hypothetical protein AB8U25_06970 [Rickettsiales endosymbiont of Dermacentor nuttalli]